MYGLPEELSIDSPLRDPGAATDMEQNDDDRARVTAIKRLQTLAQQDRIYAELEWQLCLDYMNGEIFLLRNKWTGELTRFRVGENRTAFSKNNVIRPINRALMAKLTRLMPAWSVQRATTDDDELFEARASEALLQFIYQNKRMDLKYVEMCEYMTALGDAFIVPEWSMNVGKPISFCPKCGYKAPAEAAGSICQQCEQQQMEEAAMRDMLPNPISGPMPLDPMASAGGGISPQVPQGVASMPAILEGSTPQTTNEIPQALERPQSGTVLNDPSLESREGQNQVSPPVLAPGHSGGVVLKVYAPWQVYVEPNVKSVSEMGWVILSERVPVHEARKRYPWAGEFIHADTLASDVNAFKFLNSSLPDASGYVTIYKYIERGTALTPQGRILHLVNYYIVQQDLNCTYDVLGYLPVCHFQFESNLKARSCWGRGWILDGHHHQRELNNLEQLMREYGEKHVRFKLLAPHGSNIREEDVTGPNLLVKFSPGVGACTPLQLNQLPSFVPERKQQLVSDARAEAGVSDMDAQNASDPNARAMSIVQAESLQQMKHILIKIYSEWAKLGYIILAMYQKYGDRDELYTTIGGESPEVFSMDDVKLNPGFDITVEIEDGLSTTQPVRLQEATNLAQIGNGVLFTDPTTGQFDVGSFATYAHLKLPNIRPDQQMTEYAAAMQLIHDFMNGASPVPSPVDDPAIFQLVCVKWLRGKGRRLLRTQDPNSQAIVQKVQMAYQYYVTQEMQAQLRKMQQGQAQAAPPGQNAGGQPPPGGAPAPGGQQSPGGQSQGGNQLQKQGAQSGSPILKAAGDTVKQADQHGEAMARMQQNHEG